MLPVVSSMMTWHCIAHRCAYCISGNVGSLWRSFVTTYLVSLLLIELKNRRGHRLCWLPTGRKNGLMLRTHARMSASHNYSSSTGVQLPRMNVAYPPSTCQPLFAIRICLALSAYWVFSSAVNHCLLFESWTTPDRSSSRYILIGIRRLMEPFAARGAFKCIKEALSCVVLCVTLTRPTEPK